MINKKNIKANAKVKSFLYGMGLELTDQMIEQLSIEDCFKIGEDFNNQIIEAKSVISIIEGIIAHSGKNG